MLQGTIISQRACAVPHCISIRTVSVMLRAANNCAANPLVPAKLWFRGASTVGLRDSACKALGCKMLWTSGLQQRCSPSLQTPLSRPCSHRPAVFQRAQHLLASRPQVRQRAHAVQPVFAKAKQAEEDAAPEAMASLKFKKGSTHKFRRILDQIRGRSYEEALMILEFLPHRACDSILPTLISAAANAKENLKMSKLNLYISECYADEAPKLKRFTNGYKGRPYKILKGVSHVTIKVKERKQAGKSIAAAAAKELAPEAV